MYEQLFTNLPRDIDRMSLKARDFHVTASKKTEPIVQKLKIKLLVPLDAPIYGGYDHRGRAPIMQSVAVIAVIATNAQSFGKTFRETRSYINNPYM